MQQGNNSAQDVKKGDSSRDIEPSSRNQNNGSNQNGSNLKRNISHQFKPAFLAKIIDDSSSDNTSSDKLWESIVEYFRSQLNDHVFSAYIEPLGFISFDLSSCDNSDGENDNETGDMNSQENSEGLLNLSAPSAFVCRHVLENFQDQITHFFAIVYNTSVRMRVLVAPSEKKSAPIQKKPFVVVKKIAKTENVVKQGIPRGDDGINPRYTFENFVVGASNEFTHAAAMQVSEQPGESYNPLFIYGGVGLGKTHLLHAIGNVVKQNNKNVLYMSSETFTNDLIQSLRQGKMDSFKARLRNIDVLLIDDIQFMSGKERTQEEFFHTFNALYNSKNQIVLTSDTIPQEIPGIEERLRTRFAWGLTADLQLPDLETRAAIVKRKALSENFELPQEVALYLAQKISSNVRELEGAFTRIQAVCSLRKQPATLEVAEATLEKILKTKVTKVSVKDIKLAVANHFSLKVSEIISKRRTRNLSFPRHIAMYLCRKHTTASYPEIGAEFGGRDHSSVIHAANVVGTKIKEELEVKNIIGEIEQALFE